MENERKFLLHKLQKHFDLSNYISELVDSSNNVTAIGSNYFIAIDAARSFVCGVLNNQDVYCWGSEVDSKGANGYGDNDEFLLSGGGQQQFDKPTKGSYYTGSTAKK